MTHLLQEELGRQQLLHGEGRLPWVQDDDALLVHAVVWVKVLPKKRHNGAHLTQKGEAEEVRGTSDTSLHCW